MPSSSPALNIALWGVPYAGGAEPEQPTATLTEVATANNATNLWTSNNFARTGVDEVNASSSWAPSIGGITLEDFGTANIAPIVTTVSGIPTVETTPNAKLFASISYAEPYEWMILAKSLSTSANASIIDTGNITGLIFNSGGWAYNASTTSSTGIAVTGTNFRIIYVRFGGPSNSVLKIGSNTKHTGSPGTDTPTGLYLGVRGNNSSPMPSQFVAVVGNTNGNWSNVNINAIAAKMVSDYAALSPDWSAIS